MTPEDLLPNGVIGHNQNNNSTLGEKKNNNNKSYSVFNTKSWYVGKLNDLYCEITLCPDGAAPLIGRLATSSIYIQLLCNHDFLNTAALNE